MEIIVSHDVIGRLMIACTRQPQIGSYDLRFESAASVGGTNASCILAMSLSHPPHSSTGPVISEILSFNGPEFYIRSWPELTRRKNRSFRSVLFSFDGAIPVGIKRGDGCVTVRASAPKRSDLVRCVLKRIFLFPSFFLSRPGSVRLNPPDSFQLEEGDEVISLAEDDDAYALLPQPEVPGNGQMPHYIEVARASERILFLNWRRDMDDMIMELDTQIGKVSVFPHFACIS